VKDVDNRTKFVPMPPNQVRECFCIGIGIKGGFSKHYRTWQHGNLTLPLHCKDTIPKIRNNFYIHVGDLYIPTIGLPVLLQENMWTDPAKK
jgi:hypothetical protein